MPFDHTLIALSLKEGVYAVHNVLRNGYLDVSMMETLQSVDVSQDNIFRDVVAPMAVWQAKRCLPKRPEDAQRIGAWLDGLPDSVCFVLMHSAEFETSYGD